ncbi:unnamed protein product, partial [Meganyctiphanes norvegica]
MEFNIDKCKKLEGMGIDFTEWFKSYLGSRQHVAVANEITSEPEKKTFEIDNDLSGKSIVNEIIKVLTHKMHFGNLGDRISEAIQLTYFKSLFLVKKSQKFTKNLTARRTNRGTTTSVFYDDENELYACLILISVGFMEQSGGEYSLPNSRPESWNGHGNLDGGAIGCQGSESSTPNLDLEDVAEQDLSLPILPVHDLAEADQSQEAVDDAERSWEDSQVEDQPTRLMPGIHSQWFAQLLMKERKKDGPHTFSAAECHCFPNSWTVGVFKLDFSPLIPVKEQMDPDPEFPTVKFPNPEEGKSALDLSFKTANENDSTVILANDPDADRLAVAEKLPDGNWKVFTGNEEGAVLGWWAWYRSRKLTPNLDPDQCYMIASTVSSKILGAIAKKEGFHFVETLTGFKWMGNKADELLCQGKTVLFAFEEAIGYMNGSEVLDKDGVSAAMRLAEMAADLQTQGKSLVQQLHHIYETYGYHVSCNSYFICKDQEIINAMFDRIRNFNGPKAYPTSVCDGKYTINSVRDLTTGYDSSQKDQRAILPVDPSSQMITFSFDNGCVLTLRTSGTEPKIKYYSEMCAKPEQKDWDGLEKELEELVSGVVENLMQPERNSLIPKAD